MKGELIKITDGLKELAQDVLEIEPKADVDSFVEETNHYLEEFDAWQTTVESQIDQLSPEEKESFRVVVEGLDELHQRIVSVASENKEFIAAKLAESHKRASGMKKYVDRFPSRITIAGKREG